MWHVGVPNRAAALRPPERHRVPVRRRNPALEELLLLRAMPLPVYQPVPLELERPGHVLAGGVLAEIGVAGREVDDTRRRRRDGEVLGDVVGLEVEVGRDVFGDWGAGDVGGEVGDCGGGGAGGVLPDAYEVAECAEDCDESHVVEVGPFGLE